MSELERKLDRLIDKLDANMSGGGRMSNRPDVNTTDGAVAASSKALFESLGKGLSSTFAVTGNLAGKAIDQTATVSDATDAVAGILKQFGTVGGIAGAGLSGLTSVLVDAVDNWQRFSDSGLQFGANAIALNEAVKKTGLTFTLYRDLMDTAIPSFANFGRGLSQGAEMFGEASQVLQNTFGNQLAKLGMTTKDLNSVLAITARGMTSIDPSTNGINMLVEKAVILAKEMDKMAQITGVSRKEQEKAIQTMQDDARIQAMLARQRRESPDKANAIDASLKAGAALDPFTQKVLTEAIAGGGIVSSEKLAELQAVLNPEIITKLLSAARDTTSGDAKVAETAALRISELFGDIVATRGTSGSGGRFVETGAISGEAVEAIYGRADNRYAIYAANIAEYIKKAGGDQALANATLLKDITNAQEGKLNKDLVDPKTKEIIAKAGEADPRAKTTEIVTNINQEITRIGAGLNTLLNEINNSITKQKTKTGESVVQGTVDATRGMSNSAYESRIKDLEIKAVELIQRMGTGNPTNYEKATDPMITFEKLMNEYKEKLFPNAPASTAPTAPNTVTPVSSSSVVPGLNQMLPNVATKVSSATEAADISKVQTAELGTTQDKVVEKLDEISTIMAQVAQHTKNTASYSKDTASSIKDVGPYVA